MNRLPRAEMILPMVIVAAAALLITSEFMTTFELTPPGAEPLKALEAADRHHYALVVLGLLAIAGTAVAITTGSRPAALAVTGSAAIALIIFLTLDLPDVNRIGSTNATSAAPLTTARAEPQAGFWLQTFATVLLAMGAGTFATLTRDQLLAPGRRWFGIDLDEDAGERPAAGTGDYQR